MRKFLKKLAQDSKANVLMISAAGTAVLVGAAGLGVDTVQWYLWNRQLQQAVDSGSLAGALNLYQGNNFDPAARGEVQRNANGAVTIERVANPPATGSFQGSNLAVEVIASTSRKLPFSSVFLDVAPTIRVRSVAASVVGDDHCVISLAPTGVGVEVAGNAQVALGCGVAANSASSDSIFLHGSSLLTANPLSAVGGIVYDPANIPDGTALLPYGVVNTDPLASRGLTVPASTGSFGNSNGNGGGNGGSGGQSGCVATNLSIGPQDTVTLSPGRYCGGLTIRGDVTFSPGVYIFDGGDLKVNSQGSLSGQGVTLILTGNNSGTMADIDLAGGATIDLRAPTQAEDSTWYDILIFQDPTGSNGTSKMSGGSDLGLEGIVYMPGGDIEFTGNSGQHADCLLLIANTVDFRGTSSLDNNCPSTITNLDLSSRTIKVVE